jgi:hypothetical protein
MKAVEPLRYTSSDFVEDALAEALCAYFLRWKAMQSDADETECLLLRLGATVGSVRPNL